MKITGMTVVAALVGTTVWTGTLPAAERQVMVCMGYTEENTPAKAVSFSIFAAIDVKIRWYDPKQCPAEAIFLTFSNETPAGLLPGALAYARPYEGTHIVVFYDRVKNRPGSVSNVLGHVIAHEVAHILQGLMRHSESGVMKAQWTGADYQRMTSRPLQFTDEDVKLIHHGLDVREARFAAVEAGGREGRSSVARYRHP